LRSSVRVADADVAETANRPAAMEAGARTMAGEAVLPFLNAHTSLG
jgi:hypothetical protein